MRVVLNYKSFLKSSAAPMTPLYTGSWNPRFATKWLGVAAELSYNPYLRNGWVAIDTGVKGAVGSPLIEFSTWEAENSTYNIVISNSFSYRFLFRKDACFSKFLARSSVEASEWWFVASGGSSILNLWGQKLSTLNRFRAHFKAITYLNYRFKNLSSTVKGQLRGSISDRINRVLGASEVDFRFRDLSINFLYLNRIVRHRVARIRFFLYERGTISSLLGNFGSYNFFGVFVDQFFFRFLQKQISPVNSISYARIEGDFRFFNRTPLLFFSFEQLVGNLSAVIFFFLEFKASPILVNFFLLLLRRLVERLVLLFAVSSYHSCNLSKAWLLQLSTFVLRRLINFLLTTHLSIYSLLILVVHMVREFVVRMSTSLVSGRRSSNGSVCKNTLVSLYSYKLRQLSSFLSVNLLFENKLGVIFPISKISMFALLGEYAKHRGRGLRLFRRRRNLFRRKKKFNFVGRWPQNYFYKKRTNSADEALGFTFSRRLYQLRRVLKFSSSSGQFTFLFFWSFQFFNFSQLNLKRRKFFFLAMRLAYFFKSFLRFFKFYAFYFKLLREWDLNGRELYSNRDDFILNLKTYCALLFLKFGRVLINFKIFCEKLFILKWKRYCVLSLNDLQNARRALIASFKWSPSNAALLAHQNVAYLRKRLPITLVVKFLAWSYASFTNIYSIKLLSDGTSSSRRYLKYLLKLRAMHAKLYVSRVGHALQSLMTENSQLSGVSQYLLDASLSSWFARSLWKLPIRVRFMRTKSVFLKVVGRVLSTATILVFFHNGVLYVKRGLGSVIRKISPVYIRKLVRRCLARRQHFRPWVLKTLALSNTGSRRLTDSDGFTMRRYTRFVENLRTYSGLRFALITSRFFTSKNLNAYAAKNSSLFFAKRVLLIWKILVRTSLQNWHAPSNSSLGALFSSKQLSFLFPDETGRLNLLGLLRERSISIGFRRYGFSEFNPKRLALISRIDAKACQEQFLFFDLAKIERVWVQAMYSVLKLVSDVKAGRFYVAEELNLNSLYARGLGLLLTPLIGADAGVAAKRVSNGVKLMKTSNLRSINIFLEIWGLYLTVNTWSTKALAIVQDSVRLNRSLASLLYLYGIVRSIDLLLPIFALLSVSSTYLKVQFSAIQSFAVLRAGVLRSELFTNLTNVYLRSYFFRNFFFNKKYYNLVVTEAKASLRLFSARLDVLSSASFVLLYKLTNWFGGSLLARLVADKRGVTGRSSLASEYLCTQPVIKKCILVDRGLHAGCEPLNFTVNAVTPRNSYLSFLGISSRRNWRNVVCNLRGAVLQRAGLLFKRVLDMRLRVVSRVWRAYRWIKRVGVRNVLFNGWAISNKIVSVNYLRNILRFVSQATFVVHRAGPLGVSQRSYSWRIGKFFNLVRSMHPLKLLVYAKKMGIWPKHLRLRPKKIKQKRVFEINPSKNKQSLVPDKDFKMPPSIFSRENYDSMNLILDFPNEDYRFAKVNTYKWVRAWRFTRNLAARQLICFIRRRLKIRYFKRTFRYRRFLRKRRFRNKLKKVAYRSIIRASIKLRALRSLKIVYCGGNCLRYFSNFKLRYSPILTHSLVVARFFKGLYTRFLGAKVTLRTNFMQSLKLQFLFLLSVSFLKKMVSFFASFVWAYRMTFGGEISFAWCFNKLNNLLLTAIRMYSLGASYYWTEPLALFNSKLLSNYVEGGVFNVRRLPDFFVIRTIGPSYYPYHTLIASLPWRTENVQLFQPYNTFLTSSLLNTAVLRFVFAATDLRAALENFTVFGDLVGGEFFQTCGFRMRLPVRRRGKSVVHVSGVKVYLKPTRRAQIIRLMRKLAILRTRRKSKKIRLSSIRESRKLMGSVDYVDSSRSFFKSLLRLRPIYTTLPKYGVKLKHYRMWCRTVRVIANAHRRVRPARLNVFVSGELCYCRTTRRYIKRHRANFRFGKHPVRMHWRQRKFFARRGVAFNVPALLGKAPGNSRINARLSRWKQPVLFSRRNAYTALGNQ